MTRNRQGHQQGYFSGFPKKGEKKNREKKVLPQFGNGSNGDERALDTVRRGNAKVLRARLSDARFFYLDDQKKALSDFQTKADNVVFFQQRGSQAQRVQRIAELSVYIAHALNLSKAQKNRFSELRN